MSIKAKNSNRLPDEPYHPYIQSDNAEKAGMDRSCNIIDLDQLMIEKESTGWHKIDDDQVFTQKYNAFIQNASAIQQSASLDDFRDMTRYSLADSLTYGSFMYKLYATCNHPCREQWKARTNPQITTDATNRLARYMFMKIPDTHGYHVFTTNSCQYALQVLQAAMRITTSSVVYLDIEANTNTASVTYVVSCVQILYGNVCLVYYGK